MGKCQKWSGWKVLFVGVVTLIIFVGAESCSTSTPTPTPVPQRGNIGVGEQFVPRAGDRLIVHVGQFDYEVDFLGGTELRVPRSCGWEDVPPERMLVCDGFNILSLTPAGFETGTYRADLIPGN